MLVCFASCSLAKAKEVGELSLLEIQQALAGKKLVELTHAFSPGIPHWPGFPDEKREMIYRFDKGRGSVEAEVLTIWISYPSQVQLFLQHFPNPKEVRAFLLEFLQLRPTNF